MKNIGFSIIYYVTHREASLSNENDKAVMIVLDKYNKVEPIHSNVDGIPSKNWPWP